jgi:hypothetical protein
MNSKQVWRKEGWRNVEKLKTTFKRKSWRVQTQFQNNHETKRRDSRNKINWRRNPKKWIQKLELQDYKKQKNLWPKSPNQTKMELKTTWNPSKEKKKKWNEKKKHGKIRKQEIQNWMSNLFDFNNTWRLQRRLHKEALILNHGNETLEEDRPKKKMKKKKKIDPEKKKKKKMDPEKKMHQWIHAVWNPEEKQMVQHLEWMNWTPNLE